jgi:hypothetical protein
LFVSVFAVCAGLIFVCMRWSRRDAPMDDFGTVYGAARCWIHGVNPYLGSAVSQAFHSAGGYARVESGLATRPSVYFLPAMPIFASVAWLPWSSVHLVWIFLSSASFLAGTYLVSRQLPLRPGGQVLVGALVILVSKPFTTGMWFGNPSILVIGIVIGSTGLALRKHDASAGVLLGVAVAIKPQLAVGLVAAFILWRQWTALGIGTMVVAAATAIAAVRAETVHTLGLWLDTQKQNLAMSLAPGNINDPSLGSGYGYQFLNIQTLVGAFTANAEIGNVIAWLSCGTLIVWYLRMRRRNAHPDLWMDFAFFSMVFLLPAYHRNYDGVVVMILLPWLVSLFQQRRYRVAVPVFFCMSLIFAGSFLWTQALFGSPSANGSILRALALRHQAIVIAALGLLLAMAGYGKSAAAVEEEERATAAV